ncbi:MAG: hypothetical protein ACXVJP_11050 [Mucilaginibacter sp.]
MDDLEEYEIIIYSLITFICITFLLSNYIAQFGVHIIACFRSSAMVF